MVLHNNLYFVCNICLMFYKNLHYLFNIAFLAEIEHSDDEWLSTMYNSRLLQFKQKIA